MKQLRISLAILSLVAVSAYLYAQNAAEEVKKQKQQIEALGISPAEVFLEQGQEAFNKKMKGSSKSCASCHGKDGSKLKGAYAKMPRLYKKEGKVMDLDVRMKTCITKEMKVKKLKRNQSWKNIALYVASLSNGVKYTVPISSGKEKASYDYGKKLWYMRVGKMDFSCAMCHDGKTGHGGKRIRLQGLAMVKENQTAAHWPAYRFGSNRLWTLEDRIRGCYKAMRMPKPPYFVKEQISLIHYMKAEANGGVKPVNVPGLVR